ncbi:hypothetical protein PMAYCL1PPCAC_31241 [Pristionchus mayeri]|uniref:Uncharacterized protein n=1 Tax=Pristionchus mayeri TaxID=1317129 RepID=A0AAN5DDK8_9BILA|nr:hypothetical protein PMAYCL1PPCAC_31241 [Pristionchus mayeri]
MARLVLSSLCLCLLILPQLSLGCTDEVDCANSIEEDKRSGNEPKRAADAAVRNRIGQSARFWGKRSEMPDDVKMKIAKSRLFWGKRSAESEQFPVDSDAVDVDYSQEPYFRSIKASLPSKLTLSSRFWGRRR